MGGWILSDACQQLLDSPADYLCGDFAGDAPGQRATNCLKVLERGKAELAGSAFFALRIS